MGKEDSDKVLVERARQGEQAAFDLLVRKYQHKVVNLVARYVRNGDALDVAQESFIKAYRALPGFKGNSAFYTWLYRIAVNTAKNHLVAMSRRPSDQDIDAEEAEQFGHTNNMGHTDTPEGLYMTEEIRATVIQVIESLPPELRTAIVLRELEGLSYEKIAESMDCPVGTVRSRIFRARAAIDKELEPLLH